MNKNQDKKTGKLAPKVSDEQMKELVELMRGTSPQKVYLFLDSLGLEERSKWRYFDKAFSIARGN